MPYTLERWSPTVSAYTTFDLTSLLPQNAQLGALSLAPDGRVFVGPYTYSGVLLDVATGAMERLGPATTGSVSNASVTPDGARFPYVGFWQNELLLLDAQGAVADRQPTGITKKYVTLDTFAQSDDRRWLIVTDHATVVLHDLLDGKKYKLSGVDGYIGAVAADPSGRFVAAQGQHKTAVWSTARRKVLSTLTPPDEDRFAGVAFTRESPGLLTNAYTPAEGGVTYRLELYDPEAGTALRSLGVHPSSVTLTALDGATAAAATVVRLDASSVMPVIQLLSLHDGRVLAQTEVPQVPRRVLRLDAERFVTADLSGRVLLFSAPTLLAHHPSARA
jgi:hypothetical protein